MWDGHGERASARRARERQKERTLDAPTEAVQRQGAGERASSPCAHTLPYSYKIWNSSCNVLAFHLVSPSGTMSVQMPPTYYFVERSPLKLKIPYICLSILIVRNTLHHLSFTLHDIPTVFTVTGFLFKGRAFCSFFWRGTCAVQRNV